MSEIKETIEDMGIMEAIALLVFGDFILFLLGGFTLVDCLFRLEHGVIDTFGMVIDGTLIALSIAAIVANTIFSIVVIGCKLVEFVKILKKEIAKSEG